MKKVIIGLCITAWVCITIFGVTPSVLHMDSTYADQDIFWSEQKYEIFKQDVKERVAVDGLKVNNFDVIASEPPIIVNYSITVPYDYAFPYGESTSHDSDAFLIIMVSLATGMFLIMLPAGIMFRTGG
ncbi:hypothetical protein LCGC14_2165350 [marine sediment metagenome]|uniref:Uncharacterized protein n=1 Tax=marine sediment metagenome TaxID=412755 RepID=A0A0F9GMR6_9ZZZZ